MGARHVRVLQAMPAVEVVPVDPARGFPLPSGRIDAAVVATPATRHRAVAEPLLAAGIPCLVEKPLATTEEDAVALAAYPYLAVGHVERWNPAVRALDTTVPDWRAAWTRLAFVRRVPPGPRGRDVPVALDLAVHDLDLLAVAADGATPTRVEAHGDSERVEAVLRFPSGRVATLVADRCAERPARGVTVTTPDVCVTLDLLAGRLDPCASAGEALRRGQPPPPPQEPGALGDRLRAVVAAVRGDGPFVPDGADGARAVAWALRVHAAATGRA
jgi:predicted dehydrogenase